MSKWVECSKCIVLIYFTHFQLVDYMPKLLLKKKTERIIDMSYLLANISVKGFAKLKVLRRWMWFPFQAASLEWAYNDSWSCHSVISGPLFLALWCRLPPCYGDHQLPSLQPFIILNCQENHLYVIISIMPYNSGSWQRVSSRSLLAVLQLFSHDWVNLCLNIHTFSHFCPNWIIRGVEGHRI